MNSKDMEEALKIISSNANDVLDFLNKEISMPNIPMPTMGGEVFWTDLASFNGWRLQQNMVTRHARILDPSDYRMAWGTVNGMYKALQRVIDSQTKYNDRAINKENGADLSAMERLKSLKELLDMGAITKEEFEEKKADLMKLF